MPGGAAAGRATTRPRPVIQLPGIQTSTVFAIVLGLEFVIQVREIIDP